MEDLTEENAGLGVFTPGMDFSRVHRSGVSAILRKGESVTASPTMRRIGASLVNEAGDGAAPASTSTPRASPMAASATTPSRGLLAAAFDYSSMRSVTSSSVGRWLPLESRRRRGDHAFGRRHRRWPPRGQAHRDVDLRALSDEVGALVFTMSAWTGDAPHDRPSVAASAPTTARVSGSPRTSLVGGIVSHPFDVIKTCMQGDLAQARAGGRRAVLRLRQRPATRAATRRSMRRSPQIGARGAYGEHHGGAGRRAADAGGAPLIEGRSKHSRASPPFSQFDRFAISRRSS